MDVPEEIIQRVCHKDERAYEELFRLAWDQAVRTCWLILRHQHDSEEVAQDAFIKLYIHRQHLKDVRAFRRWFYRILVNTALDKVRKRKTVIDIDEIRISNQSNDILQAERRMLIDEAMRHLSYGERTAVVLVHFIGYTEAEAAEAAGWKLGKLKYRLNRGRRVLAREINEEVKTGLTKGGGSMSDIFRKALMEDAARINVSQMTWKQVKQGHRRTRGKAAWQRRALVYGVAAVLVLMAIGVSGFVSPVMAAMLQKIPIIGELYSFNGPKLNHYASDVNSSATDKGITVTVPKVYYDGRRLLLIYIIEVPEGYEPIYGSQINLATTKIQLNGKPLSFQSVVGMDSLVSTNMYRGDVGWDLSSDQAPQNSMLTIPIDQVGTVKGNWTLSVPISSTEVNKTIDTAFPQNASTTYDGITLTANKVSKGPVYTDVSMQLRQALQTDGKPISKMSLVELFGVPMNFNVLDTNHRFMNVAYFTDQHFKKVGNEKIWDFTIHFETPSSDVKAIVIEPILMVLYKEGVTEGNCPTIPQLAVTVPLN